MKGEVYIDDANLPVRLQLTADLGAGGTLTALLDLEDVSRELLVGIPPEDAVRNVESIKEALELVGATPLK